MDVQFSNTEKGLLTVWVFLFQVAEKLQACEGFVVGDKGIERIVGEDKQDEGAPWTDACGDAGLVI